MPLQYPAQGGRNAATMFGSGTVFIGILPTIYCQLGMVGKFRDVSVPQQNSLDGIRPPYRASIFPVFNFPRTVGFAPQVLRGANAESYGHYLRAQNAVLIFCQNKVQRRHYAHPTWLPDLGGDIMAM
ncbi:hypothetical protein [Candidatus Venteria ishoeyi]|uniref:hypothetical protein n=1 Tax=Candidatus Venteria ishoeyi TaxID=1899563 RepID=UPI0011B0DA10|nr:hypothetical protein [Candidatus Venteria ishoeyi]MDM8544949.1 hypothetical protein [Candidatus Venteria ishoeyi]